MNMTPAKRLIAAANCQEPDRVPVVLFGLYPRYFKKWAKASGRDIVEDLASTTGTFIEYFRQWPEVVPLINGPNNQMSLGLCTWFRKKTGKSPTPQHTNIMKVKKKLSKVSIPDLKTDELMQKICYDWQRMIELLPSEERRKFGGLIWNLEMPFGLTCLGISLSFSRVFRLFYEDPSLIHDLLDFHTRSLIALIKAVENLFIQSNISLPRFQLAEEMLPMLSPIHVREFCIPYIRRIYKASRSPIKLFHCDNYITHMPDAVTGLGANVFFGNFSDYGELKTLFGNKMALMGNVPSVDTFTGGRPEDVDECCKWLIRKCGPGGGFILSTGGSVDPFGKSPMENIDAMVRAAEKYGKYPLTTRPGAPPQRYRAVMSSHFQKKAAKSLRPKEPFLNKIADQICQGNTVDAVKTLQDALETGLPPEQIYLQGLCLGLNRATDLFYKNEFFHPEMERADKAFQKSIDALGSSFHPEYYKGKVVIGSLSMHDCGIRIIEIMIKGAGLQVINLGRNVSTKRLVDSAVEVGAQVIAMGVYFYGYEKRAERVARILKERGLGIKTLVGGMAILPQMVEKLKVDAFAANGLEAREKVLELIGK